MRFIIFIINIIVIIITHPRITSSPYFTGSFERACSCWFGCNMGLDTLFLQPHTHTLGVTEPGRAARVSGTDQALRKASGLHGTRAGIASRAHGSSPDHNAWRTRSESVHLVQKRRSGASHVWGAGGTRNAGARFTNANPALDHWPRDI